MMLLAGEKGLHATSGSPLAILVPLQRVSRMRLAICVSSPCEEVEEL